MHELQTWTRRHKKNCKETNKKDKEIKIELQ